MKPVCICCGGTIHSHTAQIVLNIERRYAEWVSASSGLMGYFRPADIRPAWARALATKAAR